MAGQAVAEHHAGDMAVQLAHDRVPEAEALAFQGEAPGGKIDKLAAAGLSGKTRRWIASLDDQLGQNLPFTLARRAQSGLLLMKSIWGMHKKPVNGLLKRGVRGAGDAGWGGRDAKC